MIKYMGGVRITMKILLNLFLRDPRHTAIILFISTIVICFASTNWLYIGVLSIITTILGMKCHRYMKILSSQCPWELKAINDNYKVALLKNQISVLINLTVVTASITIMFFLCMSEIIKISAVANWIIATETSGVKLPFIKILHSNGMMINDIAYLAGIFKFVVMYAVFAQIHNCSIMTIVSIRKPSMLSNFTIDRCRTDGICIFPIIKLDEIEISNKRYSVTYDDKLIAVSITPPLSLTYNTQINVSMVEPNDTDRITVPDDVQSKHDHKRCFLSCRNVVKISEQTACCENIEINDVKTSQ